MEAVNHRPTLLSTFSSSFRPPIVSSKKTNAPLLIGIWLHISTHCPQNPFSLPTFTLPYTQSWSGTLSHGTTTWCGYTWTWDQLFFLLWCCQGFCQMGKISLKTFQPVASEMRIPPSIHSSLSKSKEETSVCGTANGFQTLSTGPNGPFSWSMSTCWIQKTLKRSSCSKTLTTSWWPQRSPKT